MVIFDIAASFIAGGAVGARAGGDRRDLALIAGGLGMGVPGLFFLERYPDWDWQYLLDPSSLPQGVAGLFITVILLASLLGHWIGSRSSTFMWFALVAFLVYVGSFWHETIYVGTLAEYQSAKAPMLPDQFVQDLIYWGPPGFIIIMLCLWRAGNSTQASSPT